MKFVDTADRSHRSRVKMKLLTVVGARPQFIKAAVLSRAIRKRPDIQEVIVHTGQHFDPNMSDIFFEELGIPRPDYNLGISGLPHGAMTGRLLEKLEAILSEEHPDYLIVYGDTNSTLAGALAAKKLDIPIVHVEAGVRNFDEEMPEEINRYVVDRVASLNFCCTWLGMENLEKEGYGTTQIPSKYYNCGDVMLDSIAYYEGKIEQGSPLAGDCQDKTSEVCLCTVHRASNTDSPNSLREIVSALNTISEQAKIIFPVHPRTKAKMAAFGLSCSFPLIEPVGYLSLLALMRRAQFVLTDSGGLVREAYYFQKPSLLLLEKPLWPELVEEGCCLTSAPDKQSILTNYSRLRSLKPEFSRKTFGDGNAGDKILNTICRHYDERL